MIKIKNINSKKGFTKEQQQYIADVVINEINKNNNIDAITSSILNDFKDDFKQVFNDKEEKINYLFYNGKEEKKELIINVINSKCKFVLNYDLKVFVEFLRRCGVYLTAKNIQNRLYEQLKRNCNIIIEMPDAYSDGNAAYSKDFIGNVPDEERTQIKASLFDLMPHDLIKLEGFNIAKNQKSIIIKKEKFTVFYKNKKDDFIIINQKYINMLPKNVELFISKDNYKTSAMVVKQNNNIIALIMPAMSKDLSHFELLPDIVENQENQFKKQVSELPTEVKKFMDDITTKMVVSQEYKNIINQNQHKNAATGHIYSGQNAELLTRFAIEQNYTSCEWVGKYQAKKLNKQVKSDAKGIVIKVYYEDDSDRSFCKFETIFNIDELEPLQKIENTEHYKNMIERLKKAV